MDKKKLLQALQTAKKILDRQHDVLTARHVLLYQDGRHASLYAVSASRYDQYGQERDNSHSLMVRVELGETTQENLVWLSVKSTIEALRTLEGADIQIAHSDVPGLDRTVIMTDGTARMVLDTSEPTWPDFFYWSCLLTRFRDADCAPAYEVPAAPLRQILNRTLHAVSQDETRASLNGLWLERHGPEIRAVATDGCCLAHTQVGWPGFPELAGGILVRRDALDLLDGLVGRKLAVLSILVEPERFDVRVTRREESVCVRQPTRYDRARYEKRTVTESKQVRAAQHVVFRIGTVTVCARLSTTQFPPYEQVIPRDSQRDITVDRKALLQAIRRVALCANARGKGVMLILAGESQVRLETDNGEAEAEHKHAAETVAATCRGFIRDVEHEPFRIPIHIPYLCGALESSEGKTIRIWMHNGLDPIRIDSPEVHGHLNVVAPMRL